VSHFDFYRFTDAREWADAGFRDVFAAPGLKLAEWPDNAAPVLPLPDWRLQIEPDDTAARQVTVHALTAHGVLLLKA
jgi:tRNA threonylcarbamoyladenosine biosynthesis protein TsaE